MFLIDLLFKKNIISNIRIRIIFHLILSDRPRKFSISTFYIHPIKVRGKDMSNLRLQILYMYNVYYCYKLRSQGCRHVGKIASIPVNSTTLSILQLMYFSVK